MITIRAIFSSLAVLASVAAYGQDMTMDAKKFNNRKVGSDQRIRSDYTDATGRQYITMNVDSPSILSVACDIQVEKGKTALAVKYQEEVIWEKEILGREQTTNEVELPSGGKYLLVMDLKNASGKHDIKWKISPFSSRE